MWAYLTPANLIDIQRQSALREMGLRARALLAEGYAADADRVLDELNARMADWPIRCSSIAPKSAFS